MYFLAPLVCALLVSGALYKTKEVWPKAAYDLLTAEKKNEAEQLLQFEKTLNAQVKTGHISALEAKNQLQAAKVQVAMDLS